jgi:hypothetical protein
MCVGLVITAKTIKATDESKCNETKANFVLTIALSFVFEQNLKKLCLCQVNSRKLNKNLDVQTKIKG